MTDKTLTVTLEVSITGDEDLMNLIGDMVKERKSTMLTGNRGLWDYDTTEKIVDAVVS